MNLNNHGRKTFELIIYKHYTDMKKFYAYCNSLQMIRDCACVGVGGLLCFVVVLLNGTKTAKNTYIKHDAEMATAYRYIIRLEECIDELDNCYMMDVVAESDEYVDFYCK